MLTKSRGPREFWDLAPGPGGADPTFLPCLLRRDPGRSALELAQSIYGEVSSELRVQQDPTRLVSSGEVERRGLGTLTNPHSYYPIPLRR